MINNNENLKIDLNEDAILKETIKEINIRESRERNFIMRYFPESKDDHKHDENGVINLFKHCDFDITSDNIDETARLGKVKSDQTPRLLLVKMKDKSLRDKLMKNLRRLKNVNENDLIKKVSIAPDYTIQERIQEKSLYNAAIDAEKKDLTGAKYRVRGPHWDRKVIKLNFLKADDAQRN